jgi:hypothetical protein
VGETMTTQEQIIELLGKYFPTVGEKELGKIADRILKIVEEGELETLESVQDDIARLATPSAYISGQPNKHPIEPLTISPSNATSRKINEIIEVINKL